MKKPRARPAERPTLSETKKWEKILAAEGLSMDSGTHRFRDMSGKRRYRLSYVGDSSTVDAIYEMQVGDNGKVKPKGVGPDDERTMP